MIRQSVCVRGDRLTIEDICCIAQQNKTLQLSDSDTFKQRINKGAEFINKLLREEGFVYGVTTGYGDSCTVEIPLEYAPELSRNLYTFHGCGLGIHFDHVQTRAIMAVRINSLAQGFSGVRYQLLQQISLLLHHDILPLIPQEGSVGASGDLTPLSYLAAVIAGEREAYYQGQAQTTASIFSALNISPLTLNPKEGLAVMNGTAVMTALACLAHQRAAYLAQLCSRITSMVSVALQGNSDHFDAQLFAVKPHAGQIKVANQLRQDLSFTGESPRNNSRLQDRYSLRCAPHIIGVLEDALPWFRQFIENELNSANDNPIIDAEHERVLHGGHFYGGHIAFAMDSLKTTVANLADLMDRQLAQLVDTKFNHGLPANLTGAKGEKARLNHGFKAVQIAVSAWTAEALKLTMPASVFSRSTECHNQDKVSMGTIAARDCIRVLELTEQVASASLIAAAQAVELRTGGQELSHNISQTLSQVREHVPFMELDIALDKSLRLCLSLIRDQYWSLYEC